VTGVAFLDAGVYRGGGRDYFSIGTYTVDSANVILRVKVTQYGELRSLFGKTRTTFDVLGEGLLSDAVVRGTIQDPQEPRFSIQFRMARLADLA
jgi:hypothetical protein